MLVHTSSRQSALSMKIFVDLDRKRVVLKHTGYRVQTCKNCQPADIPAVALSRRECSNNWEKVGYRHWRIKFCECRSAAGGFSRLKNGYTISHAENRFFHAVYIRPISSRHGRYL